MRPVGIRRAQHDEAGPHRRAGESAAVGMRVVNDFEITADLYVARRMHACDDRVFVIPARTRTRQYAQRGAGRKFKTAVRCREIDFYERESTRREPRIDGGEIIRAGPDKIRYVVQV